MENNKGNFTQFELNIIELFERLQGAEVRTSKHGNVFYVNDGYDSGYSKGALIEHCIHGIAHWLAETDTQDMINHDLYLESVGDYLPLLLSLPLDTTVLAVGNGAVAAPSTTTAYLHEDYHGNKLLAVYDYEVNEEAVKADLEHLFPTIPPQWLVVFRYDNKDYDYPIIIGAEDRTEALTKALPIFNSECDWHYMPWKSIDIKPMDEETAEPETAEAKKPILCNYTEAIAFVSYKLRTAIQDTLNAVDDCYEITEAITDKQNTELDTATNHIIYAVADTIAEYLDF